MSEKNNLDWRGYEEITRYIYETLGQEYGIKIVGYGDGFKIKGMSGVDHQIDILTEQSNGKCFYRTVIECKYWKKKINKDIIMKLSSIMEDSEIEKGIIVSKEGFTRDALGYARHKNIEVVQLREAVKDDRNGDHTIDIGILEIHSKVIRTRPTVTCIDFGTYKITDESEILSMFYASILLPNDRKVQFREYMRTFQDELYKQKLLKTFSKTYEIEGKIIEYQDKDIHFDNITFIGFLVKTNLSSNRSFNIKDQVWMIMKKIFERKVLIISKSGIIFKDPS